MIEVHIPREEIEAIRDRNEVLANITVLGHLRSAGVPVIGVLGLRGVLAGELSMHLDGDEMVYRWTPPQPGVEPEVFDDLA